MHSIFQILLQLVSIGEFISVDSFSKSKNVVPRHFTWREPSLETIIRNFAFSTAFG